MDTSIYLLSCLKVQNYVQEESVKNFILLATLQVCYNDVVIVDVRNHMPGREIAVHWHGILQHETPYMDGVPLITQCPISEGQEFRYNFTVDTAGTHFYHSHSGIPCVLTVPI